MRLTAAGRRFEEEGRALLTSGTVPEVTRAFDTTAGPALRP
ncbi:hypothetical protein [Streptomyces sp. NPDC048385]